MKKYLLIEPDFPVSRKSKNHKDYLPIGLLKIARYLQDQGHYVTLVRGNNIIIGDFDWDKAGSPDEIWITSLFTYWAKYVKKSVQYYKELFPKAVIKVGGIYASLRPPEEVKDYTGCDEVHQGVIPQVEEYAKDHFPSYDILKDVNPHPVDYQILHASRGCTRHCEFCGTWKIEPRFEPKRSIKNEVQFSKVIFYDNNFLMNPYIEDILEELIDLKSRGEIKWVESQSGLDGRILQKKPHLGKMLKKAGFRYPRIAWDGRYTEKKSIKKQIGILIENGYHPRDIFIFMIYNHEIPFREMEKKRIECWKWRVQMSDCRFRPLEQMHDDYNPYKRSQESNAYHIHQGWTDQLVRQFRRNVRRQNICVRYRFRFYSRSLENKHVKRDLSKKLRNLNDRNRIMSILEKENIDYWFPEDISFPNA